MNRKLQELEAEFNTLLKTIHDSSPPRQKKEDIKCLPLKVLNKWYLENGERPELDEYFRMRQLSWDSLPHRDRQRIYNTVNEYE